MGCRFGPRNCRRQMRREPTTPSAAATTISVRTKGRRSTANIRLRMIQQQELCHITLHIAGRATGRKAHTVASCTIRWRLRLEPSSNVLARRPAAGISISRGNAWHDNAADAAHVCRGGSTVLLRSVEELCDPTIIISIISWRLLTSLEGGKLLLSSCVHACGPHRRSPLSSLEFLSFELDNTTVSRPHSWRHIHIGAYHLHLST
jgi:hypothetical protein